MTLILGCGGSSGEPAFESKLVAITVTPDYALLVIEDGAPAMAEFHATGTFEDGSSADITEHVTFSLENPLLGELHGATLTTSTDVGARTRVHARLGDVYGTATVVLRVRRRHADPAAGDLPADPAPVFDGPVDEDRAPELVYPASNVLMPPNLRALELHFYPGDGNTLFEIAFASDTTDIEVYTRCTLPMGNGCIYTPDASVWRWIAESNRGGALSVSVRGTDDSGSGVGTSTAITVSFSQDDLQGAIYYWTTSSTSDSATAIMRFDFGSMQTEPEQFIGTEMTGGKCVGCHALSRKGDKLITAAQGSTGGHVLLLDVATRAPIVLFDSTPRSAFSSWSPDGTQYVGVFANEKHDGFISYDLNVFDGTSGELVDTIDVGGSEANPTTHPDWSPQGDRIAYTRVGHTWAERRDEGTIAYAEQASLRMITRTGAGWSEPVDLTRSTPGQGTFYPAFSPAGDLLVFNQSACSDGKNGPSCDAYDDPGAALHVMAPEAGAVPVELAAANAPGATDTGATVQSSYPKWAPFTFRRSGELGKRLYWLTFSSNRNYGLRVPPDGHTLIWMAGVDPDAALDGRDPSFAAFALPFQDLTTDNHTAQWAERSISVE